MTEVRLRGKALSEATGVGVSAIQRARCDGRLSRNPDGNTINEVLLVCTPKGYKGHFIKSADSKRRSAVGAGRPRKTKSAADNPAAPPAKVSRETPPAAPPAAPPSDERNDDTPETPEQLGLSKLRGQAANENLKALETSKILVNAFSAATAVSVISREVVVGTRQFVASNVETWCGRCRKLNDTEFRDYMISEFERLFQLIGEDVILEKFDAAIEAEESARRKKRVL